MTAPSDTATDARCVALERLERIARDDAFVGRLQSDALDDRTQRQARDLVAGVTRWRRWLDFLLAAFYDGDLGSMERRLQQILRLGLYELLKQETPAHAAVDEYVDLAKHTVRSGAGGLVNGILRSVDRQRDDLPTPATGDMAEDLAIRQSHPSWMIRRWMDRFGGKDAEAFARWNNRRPTYGLRVNRCRATVAEVADWLDAHNVTYARSPYLDDVFRVQRLQAVIRGGLIDDGRVAVQDESAALVVRLLDPQPGETVLDLCAAPGGKATYAAARMDGEGTLLATDINRARLGLVEDAAQAQGVGDVLRTEAADARDLPGRDDVPRANRVLLDVPCSGLGVLAKRADLRWQRTPADLDELTTLQDELLDAAAKLVRPGGLLVYSTCTTEPEENRDRVRAFLDRHAAFALEPAGELLPTDVVADEGVLETLPFRHRTDGAFAARLRRRA